MSSTDEMASTKTYNLVDHDQDPCLSMLRALRVPIYCNAEALVEPMLISSTITGTRSLVVYGFGIEQEDICSGVVCEDVEVFEHIILHST